MHNPKTCPKCRIALSNNRNSTSTPLWLYSMSTLRPVALLSLCFLATSSSMSNSAFRRSIASNSSCVINPSWRLRFPSFRHYQRRDSQAVSTRAFVKNEGGIQEETYARCRYSLAPRSSVALPLAGVVSAVIPESIDVDIGNTDWRRWAFVTSHSAYVCGLVKTNDIALGGTIRNDIYCSITC